MHEALEALIRFEERVSSFYVWLSAELIEDSEAAQLFITLAAQEQGHAERLRMEERILVEDERELEVHPDVSQAVEISVKAMDGFMARPEPPGSIEALGFTLDLESRSGEQLGRALLAEAVPELARTLGALEREDARHAEMLQEALALRLRRRRAANEL
ncbi:MAG: hypothetical protein P1V51_01310 [Deltaproteobacteria bacterium]|nr:hypothetical protein [Deltaproteobacteria bacterium]